MDRKDEAAAAISDRMAGVQWTDPTWLDELKQDFPDLPEKAIDDLYIGMLEEKINSLSPKTIRNLILEQKSEPPAIQNPLLCELIRTRFRTRPGKAGTSGTKTKRTGDD